MTLIKKYHKTFLAFFIPLIIYSTFFLSKGVLTKNNFATSDSLAQFVPTYQYLHDVLHNKASFPYTQSKGLGGTMYGAFFYGISSPINLLVYFFDDVQLFMFLMTIIKISLAGLTMYILLKKKIKDSYPNLIFSLGYSLSSYILLYYTNIMWLDSIWLAPLLVLSIDKLIHQKKDVSYILILFYALISNYYSAYFLVLFSIIYFFYELYISNTEDNFFKNNKKLIIHFFIITFLTGLLIAFILIPVFVEFLNYVRVYDNEIKLINFQYLDLISGTYIGFGSILDPINYYGVPTYCGTIIIPLIIYYFTNKKISSKEKEAAVFVLLTFILPIIFPPLNMLWHMFTNPIGFNYRYSFLTIMFMLLIAAKSYNNLNGSKKIIKLYIIIYIILSISMAYGNYHSPDYYLLYLNIKKIIITLLFTILSAYLVIKNKKKLIPLCLIFDLTINLIFFYNTAVFVSYNESNQIENNLNIALKEYDKNYRLENVLPLTFNDSLNYRYRGATTFLSSSNIHSMRSHNILRGIKEVKNSYTYLNHDIISDTLLGIKYIYDDNLNLHYEYIDTLKLNDKEYYLQINKSALPLGYLISNEIKNLDNENYFEFNYLNKLLNSLNNTNTEYFKSLKVTKENNHFIIEKNKFDSQIYIINNELPRKIDNRKYSKSYSYFKYYNNTDENLVIEFKKDIDTIEAYTLDYEKFYNLVENLKKIKVIENKDSYIKFEVNSEQNEIVMLTIPYELGWNIKVDGKKTTYTKLLNSFIGIDTTKGEHTIELSYEQPFLKEGIILSLISLITLIAYKLRILKAN